METYNEYFRVGDLVKVIDQDIWGEVLEVLDKYIVIEDKESEYEYPENRLEFKPSDLQRIGNGQQAEWQSMNKEKDPAGTMETWGTGWGRWGEQRRGPTPPHLG